MKRRDFLKYGSAGIAGVAFSGLTRNPLFRIGDVFADSSSAWKFGLNGDTQWTTTDPAGTNPNGVPVSIINQLNSQFISKGVKFVIQVGDLTENGNDADLAVRAGACRSLYDANIGFFGVRGNHETYASPGNSFAIPVIKNYFPQHRGMGNLFGDPNYNDFNSCPLHSDLDGISYTFDYQDVRFVMLDTWATPSKNASYVGYNFGYTVADQQAWISQRLDKTTRGTDHAFVFTHQNLIGENHQDTLFAGYADANPTWQNNFYQSMAANGARYFISGHDHIHQRSSIVSPDGRSTVEELICASCSSKFYTPKSLTDGNWKGQKSRETSISQEMFTVGFYIFTIDGPTVIVDYYSDDHGNWYSDGNYPNGGTGTKITPTFNFVKKETWGYSLSRSGIASFTVLEGQNYVINTPNTVAKVLKAGGTAKDYNSRSFVKPAVAWWTDKSTVTNANAVSDVVTILGTSSAAIKVTGNSNVPNDPVGIQLSYDPSVSLARNDLNQGRMIAVNVRDESGNWVNAVDKNFAGTKRFVYGAYNKAFPVGTHGVDDVNKVAWAVVNHDSDFAVIKTGN